MAMMSKLWQMSTCTYTQKADTFALILTKSITNKMEINYTAIHTSLFKKQSFQHSLLHGTSKYPTNILN
jgi:hypothetical protein